MPELLIFHMTFHRVVTQPNPPVPVVSGTFSLSSSGKTKLPIPPLPSNTSSPVDLEPYYYGQIQGDVTLGREINTHTFSCHICSVSVLNLL